MSENTKDRKLPGKDYFRNFKTDKKKIKHSELSEQEKREFAEAFSDSDDDGDVKTFTPGKAQVKPEIKTADAAEESREDMYALPQFDADGFFSTLSFNLEKEKAPDKKAPQQKKVEAPVASTQAVNLNKAPVAAEKKSKSDDTSISSTRYFNLRSVTRKIQLENKNRKSFMQNFRVLSKDKEDRAIIEAAPVGKGGKGLADSVRTKKGEDIFEAVEKAYLNKDEVTQIKIENTAVRKERDFKGGLRASDIKADSEKKLAKHRTAILIYLALFAVSFVLTVFFSDKKFYAVFSLIVCAVLFVMNLSAFVKSFKAIRSVAVVPETALTVMTFFVLIHNIAMLSLQQSGSLYTLCVIFACFMRSFSEFYRLRNRIRLVSMAKNTKRLSILQRIPVKSETASFAANVEGEDEPDIFYCAKAFLDTSVEEPVFDDTKENKYYVFTMSIVLLASLVVGLLCFASQLTGISFISALTATVCALLPIMYDPMSRYIFFHKGKDMLKYGACVSGREALQHIGSSDGFVIDARDVFAGEISRFRKSAISNIAQNDSAVFAAAMLNEAGSVLAPCFDSFIKQMNIALPEVENFQYEERLGYSAWIMDRKILVGNRQMLLNHSVTVPSKEHEKAYGKGRFVMYVVIDGEISATFLVNYKVLSSLRKYSRDFSKTGLILMFSSREAFLNEEIVAGKLSLDITSVKVLSSKATAIMDKFNSGIENQEPTGLLCSRKKRSLMHLIMGCYNLNTLNRFALTMMVVGQILGTVLLVASPILKMTVFINPITIIILRLLWFGVVTFVTERRK